MGAVIQQKGKAREGRSQDEAQGSVLGKCWKEVAGEGVVLLRVGSVGVYAGEYEPSLYVFLILQFQPFKRLPKQSIPPTKEQPVCLACSSPTLKPEVTVISGMWILIPCTP